MRIVQLANFYTPTSGGLRTCLEEIGRGYLEADHERILVVPATVDADEDTPSGRRLSIASPRLPGASDYRVLTARGRVLAALDELRPDLLEISDKLSFSWLARWARRARVPVVLFSHERLDAILRPRVPGWVPLPAIANVVNRRLSLLADLVVVASAFSAEEFLRIGAVNVRQIPLGVDLDVFHPAAARATRTGTVHIATLGRLSGEKSTGQAIECLRVLRSGGLDAELSLVGDGPLRTRLERQAAGLPVRFLGHVSARDTLARLVASADIALSPSGAETFGLATLEALACGTPVVVPAAGAARELVASPGSGVVCDGTPEGLADGVRALLAIAPSQRRAAARQAAEAYPWSDTVAQLLAAYTAALASASRPN